MSPNRARMSRDTDPYKLCFYWLASRLLLLGSSTALICMAILFITPVLSLTELLLDLAIVAPCMGSGAVLYHLAGHDFDFLLRIVKLRKGFAWFPILAYTASAVPGLYFYLLDPTQGHQRDLLLMSISPLPWLITGIKSLSPSKKAY